MGNEPAPPVQLGTCPTCGSDDKELYLSPCNDLYWQGTADKFHTYLGKPIKLNPVAASPEQPTTSPNGLPVRSVECEHGIDPIHNCPECDGVAKPLVSTATVEMQICYELGYKAHEDGLNLQAAMGKFWKMFPPIVAPSQDEAKKECWPEGTTVPQGPSFRTVREPVSPSGATDEKTCKSCGKPMQRSQKYPDRMRCDTCHYYAAVEPSLEPAQTNTLQVFKSLADKVEDGEVSIDSLVDGSYSGEPAQTTTIGTKVYHRNLRLRGTISGKTTDPTSALVDFEDGETREVTAALLDRGEPAQRKEEPVEKFVAEWLRGKRVPTPTAPEAWSREGLIQVVADCAEAYCAQVTAQRDARIAELETDVDDWRNSYQIVSHKCSELEQHNVDGSREHEQAHLILDGYFADNFPENSCAKCRDHSVGYRTAHALELAEQRALDAERERNRCVEFLKQWRELHPSETSHLGIDTDSWLQELRGKVGG